MREGDRGDATQALISTEASERHTWYSKRSPAGASWASAADASSGR